MQNEPIYHLNNVVLSKDSFEDFEGPLDLILLLLSKNKIEIRDIRISELLEQYLSYLQIMQDMDLEIASEFVQMASHLTYIKTRMLLTEEKETTELEELVNALEDLKAKQAYSAVCDVAPELGAMSRDGYKLHTRGPLPRGERAYDYSHSPDELIASLARILLRTDRTPNPQPVESIRKAAPRPLIYNVRDKSRQLEKILREKGSILLRELFNQCKSRSEIVATFLSILELCSAGNVEVQGERGSYNIYGRFAQKDSMQ